MVLQIEEVDETGNLTATYVESSNGVASRVDIIVPEKGINIWSRILNVFLPAGYPHSVTPDYIQYQIYDSLQAFSSSIAGLLSSRAVLQGVGVGDASASPTAALLLSVLQDSMGRIATILFAHKLGTSLEPECKMYRLAADVFNDTAMIFDCMSPALPKSSRVILLSFSSVLRALCGVAAGSSKASLSAHFAKWGNLGDLNAKDSSQETVISLFGMLVGSVVVARISSPAATWTALILLLSVHLAMNHAAVRAVSMHRLNRQRANLVISNFLEQGKVLTPEEVSHQERIFDWDGILRWNGRSLSAKARIGIPLQEMLNSIAPSHQTTSSIKSPETQIAALTKLYREEEYIMWYSKSQRCAYIVLKEGASPSSQLRGWAHALFTVQRSHNRSMKDAEESQKILELVGSTLESICEHWEDFLKRLKEKGWDVEIASLESAPGTRIRL